MCPALAKIHSSELPRNLSRNLPRTCPGTLQQSQTWQPTGLNTHGCRCLGKPLLSGQGPHSVQLGGRTQVFPTAPSACKAYVQRPRCQLLMSNPWQRLGAVSGGKLFRPFEAQRNEKKRSRAHVASGAAKGPPGARCRL